MKRFYTLMAFAIFTTFSFAQNAAISACIDDSDPDAPKVSIDFDLAQNCPAAPGSLAGMAEIGFHSGANQWGTVVDWNAAGASTAANNGSDVFSVSVDPMAYYGIAMADLMNIYFVFNQGPADAAMPWASEGKDDDGAGGCSDYFVTIADLASCSASSTIDVELSSSLTIQPNPFSESALITFANPENKVYDATVTTLTGQIVSNFTVTGNSFELQRDNLSSGMYFVNMVSEEGKIATTKVMVK